MSDELLRRATNALRASADGASDRSQETRARLLASARVGHKRKNRLLFAVLPIAAALAVSSAWAGATGRLTTAWHVVESLSEPVPTAHRDTGPAALNLARSMAAASASQTAVSSQEASAPQLAPPASDTSPAASSGPSASAPASSAKPDAGDADHSAYLVAHRSHFGGSDPATALGAWDTYLRALPSGRFSLEARYNRALCLVKLGRKAEASQALEPFARGAYGRYRQAEAAALRDALGAR